MSVLIETKTQQVTIKPLEWDGFGSHFIAYSVVGEYYVSKINGVWSWSRDDEDTDLHGTQAESEHAAKAAVQADYEAFILSTISNVTNASEESAGTREVCEMKLQEGRTYWTEGGKLAGPARNIGDAVKPFWVLVVSGLNDDEPLGYTEDGKFRGDARKFPHCDILRRTDG